MSQGATEERIFAIGDVHGCYDKLVRLLDRLPYRPERDTLVFLGDYLDRGRRSQEVISLVERLAREGSGVIPLLGNHEHLLLEYGSTGDELLLPLLRELEADATVESYGRKYLHSLRDLECLPASHRRFLAGLRPYWETRDFIFVHAGVLPGLPLAEQDVETLTGVREIFLNGEHGLGKRVVFGHTPFELPLVTPTKIGIDTGAAYGNLLTAVELPSLRFFHA